MNRLDNACGRFSANQRAKRIDAAKLHLQYLHWPNSEDPVTDSGDGGRLYEGEGGHSVTGNASTIGHEVTERFRLAIVYFQSPLFPVAQFRSQLVAMLYRCQQRLHLLRIVEAGPSGEYFVLDQA